MTIRKLITHLTIFAAATFAATASPSAHAWWNKDWTTRTKLTLT